MQICRKLARKSNAQLLKQIRFGFSYFTIEQWKKANTIALE